jgi:chromosome partitioning protein
MEELISCPFKRIAISSQKGGVAKTTTCLSLGASLAEHGLRVLLIDLDPQAHLTQALSVDPESLRRTSGDVLLLQANLEEVTRETEFLCMDLLPANRGLILVEKLLHNIKGYEFRLESGLDALQDQFYEVILFDCPPTFSPLTINALTAADLAIVPVTCDFFSMQSFRAYMNLLKMVRKNLNPTLEYRLLITMFDSRTRVSKMFLDQFQEKFHSVLFETVIPIDAKLRESSLFGRPINLYAKKARGAQEYRALATELMTCQKMTI